ILILSSVICGCKKKKNDSNEGTSPATNYTVPTTYSGFTNADYADVTTSLHMFKVIEAQLKLGVPSSGTHALDAQALKNMYSNTGSPFTDSTQWNGLTIQLNEQTSIIARSAMNSYLDSFALASQSTVAASEHVGGLLLTTILPAKNILLAPSGINYAQIIQKVGFSSVFMNQIHAILTELHEEDNTVNVSGKTYTAQEHAWDRAFGYAGFPGSYSADTLASPAFWGVAANKAKYFYIANYSIQVDGGINTTKTLVNAFLKGRAAISNKDYNTRDEQIAIINSALEKFLGGCVLHEIGELTASANAKYLDDASRNSSLSEILGFVMAIEYAPNRTTISDDDLQDILDHLHSTDLWQISLMDVAYVKNKIALIYGLDSVKDTI
ncbi:MAG TPA: DUF4856 domain-containing protein, partial [Cytophagaceae bacterium]|nr:DUF4856 domain-containing protein [Cytophagaceae bacterium]